MKLSFGDRITVLRKKKKFTPEQLAKLIGVKTDTIDRYENDLDKPSMEKLIELANALNVSLDFLTGRTEYELEFKNIQRIIDVQNMNSKIQDTAYYTIDMLIRVAKTEDVYQTDEMDRK